MYGCVKDFGVLIELTGQVSDTENNVANCTWSLLETK